MSDMDEMRDLNGSNIGEERDEPFEGEETLSPSIATNGSSHEVYPDAAINITRDTASVFQLKRKWEKDLLLLSPDFQREFVWGPTQQSELIESILMGIPLPAFYVREDNRGIYIVVDGKQRLTTLFNFIDGKFRLKNLKILRERNDLFFEDLTPLERNKIEDYSLNVNVIKSPTDDRVTFDLFDRVNRSGTQLNNQEMRNALYQGLSTRLIKEMSEYESFIKATEKSLPTKHMKDRYFVLRFISFYMLQKGESKDVENGGTLEYKSNVEDFLGKSMRFINTLSDDDPLIAEIKDVFRRGMERAVRVLLPIGGFRLPNKDGVNRRPLNMSFFESMTYLLTQTFDETDDVVKYNYLALLGDKDFVSTLTYSVDSKQQIDKRYEEINKYIKQEDK